MNVLMVTTSYPRYQGDFAGNFIHALAKELVSQGISVSVLAPHGTDTKGYEVWEGVEVHRFSYFWPMRLHRLCYGETVVGNVRKSILAKIQVPLFLLAQTLALMRLLWTNEIRVIHSHWIIPSGLVAAVGSMPYPVRHVLTLHAADVFYLKKLPFGAKMARFILNRCDGVVAVSAHVKDTMDGMVGSGTGIIVSPVGVDLESFRIPLTKNEARQSIGIKAGSMLLFVGALREKKGVEYLIRSMPMILEKRGDTQLVVVGDGPLREQLEGLAKTLGLGEYVRFEGWVSHERVHSYYAASDLIVVPSIVDQYGETEGMPAVVLEAMASARPVVGTDVSGIPDVVKHGYNGVLVEPKNPRRIALGIIDLLGSEKLEAMGEAARETAKNYSWSSVAAKYVALYCPHDLSYNPP